MSKEYYKSQLENLKVESNEDIVNMKLTSDNGETKNLGVNKDSVFSLMDYLVTVGLLNLDEVEHYLGVDEYKRVKRA